MPKVRKILEKKGPQVMRVGRSCSVLDAVVLMNEHKIGAVVVADEDKIVGVFTERDLLRRVVCRHRDPAQTSIGEVMTSDVVCCQADNDLEDARRVFMQQRIRHLPVVTDAGELEGMISIGDLNAWDLDGQEMTIHYLHEYIYGRV